MKTSHTEDPKPFSLAFPLVNLELISDVDLGRQTTLSIVENIIYTLFLLYIRDIHAILKLFLSFLLFP